MENATKALLIAASVIVVIMVISLGLVIYTRAANSADSADLSTQEIQAQNEKFVRYNGTNKRGSEVNALLQTVLSNNLNAKEDSEKVAVTGDVSLSVTDTSITSYANTSTLYTIVVNQGGPGGLVSTISIKKQ